MALAMKLARTVRNARKAHGLSLRAASAKSGVAHTLILAIETGEHANPSVSTLKKLAKLFSIDPVDLFKACL